MQQMPDQAGDDNGPWRDGWYVVASKKTEMPRRCMVCGEDVDVLGTTPVPLPRRARGIGSATYWLLAGERFDVRHGRCQRHRVLWSKRLGIVSGITTLVSMGAFVWSMLASNGRFGLIDALLTGAFAVSFVSTIVFAMVNLRIEKTDGVRVWIGGFGRRFRAKLPPLRVTR
jgi:hypothetical protein